MSTHELEPDYHWLEGETKPWGTVNKHSGFQLTVFRGEARDFDDLFLGRYLEANEAWISELRQKGRAVDMSIDFLLDAHHSYSPYLELPITLMAKLVELHIPLVVTPSCAETIFG